MDHLHQGEFSVTNMISTIQVIRILPLLHWNCHTLHGQYSIQLYCFLSMILALTAWLWSQQFKSSDDLNCWDHSQAVKASIILRKQYNWILYRPCSAWQLSAEHIISCLLILMAILEGLPPSHLKCNSRICHGNFSTTQVACFVGIKEI